MIQLDIVVNLKAFILKIKAKYMILEVKITIQTFVIKINLGSSFFNLKLSERITVWNVAKQTRVKDNFFDCLLKENVEKKAVF